MPAVRVKQRDGRRSSSEALPSAKPIALGTSSDALTSWHMADEKQRTRSEKQDQERADRDHDRSEEAHWRVAETGAQEEKRPSEAARPSDKQEDDWENEGGALDREPKETTE
jgi:hypothetical protein